MSLPQGVVGIDLGTTNSVISYWNPHANRAEVIPNDQGNRTTPSVVSYGPTEVFVGEVARNKTISNPHNTVFSVKRLMGRMYDQVREDDASLWPFKIVPTEDGRARIEVFHDGAMQWLSPEEISATVLGKLKAIAERHLGVPVTHAVVTVPAYFTEPQKRATRDAGLLAGLEVLDLLPEPTAAALAYGLDQRSMDQQRLDKMAIDGWHVVVFDLGGGTLDVSVLRLDGRGSFAVRAITGDFHLGGDDFDVMLVKYFAKQYEEMMGGARISEKGMSKLRTESEAVKRILSTADDALLDMMLDGQDFVCEITRDQFEHLCGDLFEDMLSEVDEGLRLADIHPSMVDDIVLVGGSTRIPRIRKLLQQKFPTKQLWDGINPDEAVAYGAAIQAAALMAHQNPPPPPPPPQHNNADISPTKALPAEQPPRGTGPRDLVVSNVTPLTLGVELSDGTLDPLVQRGTRVPVSVTDFYTTATLNQRSVVIKIYEGQAKYAKDNSFLGKFVLELPPAPIGVPKVEVRFEITAQGLFNISATDLATSQTASVQISGGGNLTAQEMQSRIGGGESSGSVRPDFGGGSTNAPRTPPSIPPRSGSVGKTPTSPQMMGGGAPPVKQAPPPMDGRTAAALEELEAYLANVQLEVERLDPEIQKAVQHHCTALGRWIDNNQNAPAMQYSTQLGRFKSATTALMNSSHPPAPTH